MDCIDIEVGESEEITLEVPEVILELEVGCD
jgi:hypothetical protein